LFHAPDWLVSFPQQNVSRCPTTLSFGTQNATRASAVSIAASDKPGIDLAFDQYDRFLDAVPQSHVVSKETTMQWTTPAYTDLRFGFEVTMYIANR
jgi:coenzyme PQQ precursor peptide PqqA